MEFIFSFEDGSESIAHYGVKGMRWGVRKTEYHSKGGTLKKGSRVSRVSTSAADPTYGNKKYVSTTNEDHIKWEKYLGNGYLSRGKVTYNVLYETTNDIKIASEKEIGEHYSKNFMNSKASKTTMKDLNYALQFVGTAYKKDYSDPAKAAALQMANQTKTGEKFINSMMKAGYGGVSDTHGRNTADDPIIIFDPDNNLKRVGNAKYTEPVQKYIEEYRRQHKR